MKVTEEMILYAMGKLVAAGNNFGQDCPEEIVWELNDLDDKLKEVRDGGVVTDDDVHTEEDIMDDLKHLNELYQ